MRERTLRVRTDKLEALSDIYRPSKIARTLEISKQRWHRYKAGKSDMPESIIDALCREYKLDKAELVLQP